ncbi:MAG: hypothetical protein RR477_08715, partial [Raoultibacter sp.]
CAHCSSNFCKHHNLLGEKNLQFVMNSKSSDMNDNKMAFPRYYLPKNRDSLARGKPNPSLRSGMI